MLITVCVCECVCVWCALLTISNLLLLLLEEVSVTPPASSAPSANAYAIGNVQKLLKTLLRFALAAFESPAMTLHKIQFQLRLRLQFLLLSVSLSVSVSFSVTVTVLYSSCPG